MNANLSAGSTAQLSGKFECGSANDITDIGQMIIIELAHCAAGAKGSNDVAAGRKDRSCNAANSHRMLLIVHGISTPACKRQLF